jgi:hypothetical protein
MLGFFGEEIVKKFGMLFQIQARCHIFLNVYTDSKNGHPDIAYLDRYAHACCSPFGAAEQRSRWWNKTPNLSERQRVFGVPPLVSSPQGRHRRVSFS